MVRVIFGADNRVRSYQITKGDNSHSFMQTIKDQFALITKDEPQKTFVKAGITNADETLTPDGQDIFLAWLLKTNGAAFKKEVADPILAARKAEKA